MRTRNIDDLIGIGADVILIDAPLPFKTWSKKGEGRSPQHHYRCLPVEDICRLPVRKIAGRNCFVFSWVPLRSVDLVKPIFDSWSAKFSGADLEWVKTLRTKPGFWSAGGYSTRKNIEVAWLGRIGKPQRADKGVPALIVAPHREHSRKPDEQYARIERLVGPGKILVELFARGSGPPAHWHAAGDELDLNAAPLTPVNEDSTLIYDTEADVWRSVTEAYKAIRERMRQGGPGWTPGERP
jgi:N6-adenosine-specific RNA methylase IME4